MSRLDSTVDRVLGRSRQRHDEYVLCAGDGFWFRPPYTDGKCPLCGEPAPGDAAPLPSWLRVDRFSLGIVSLLLASLGMSVLVLVAYLAT